MSLNLRRGAFESIPPTAKALGKDCMRYGFARAYRKPNLIIHIECLVSTSHITLKSRFRSSDIHHI